MNLVLYCPDIPQNTGTMLRLASCFGVKVHIIEPCGFILGGAKFKRAGLDYLDHVDLVRHESFEAYLKWTQNQAQKPRKILLTTKTNQYYDDFQFQSGDHLMVGRESSGVPEFVLQGVDHCVKIPMQPGMRSINVALSAGIVLSEAMRQTLGYETLKQE